MALKEGEVMEIGKRVYLHYGRIDHAKRSLWQRIWRRLGKSGVVPGLLVYTMTLFLWCLFGQ